MNTWLSVDTQIGVLMSNLGVGKPDPVYIPPKYAAGAGGSDQSVLQRQRPAAELADGIAGAAAADRGGAGPGQAG